MAECKTALRGDEVVCLTHIQRYVGCVLDERDRLKVEVGRLNEKVKVAELQNDELRAFLCRVSCMCDHHKLMEDRHDAGCEYAGFIAVVDAEAMQAIARVQRAE